MKDSSYIYKYKRCAEYSATRCAVIAVSVAVATVMLSVPAYAQEQHGTARFDFAPNYFRREQANAPLPGAKNAGAGANGSVPKGGASVLGLNPKLFEKPHVVATTVSAVPSFTTPAPITPPPNMPPESNFGKPASAPSPSVAQAKAGHFGKLAPGAKPSSLNSDRNVHGRLLHHPMHYKVPASGLAATPGALASYGKGFGYTPGPMAQPAAPEAGVSATKDVYGKLLRK